MTTTTETADPSALIWNWLQRTAHFECGGWSWETDEPFIVRCICGTVLDVTDAGLLSEWKASQCNGHHLEASDL